MEEIKNAINIEIARLDYYIKANNERSNTTRAKELSKDKKLLIKILSMLD